jgi:hypothetical protein
LRKQLLNVCHQVFKNALGGSATNIEMAVSFFFSVHGTTPSFSTAIPRDESKNEGTKLARLPNLSPFPTFGS